MPMPMLPPGLCNSSFSKLKMVSHTLVVIGAVTIFLVQHMKG